MSVGATIFNQNYADWDRYEAEERGEIMFIFKYDSMPIEVAEKRMRLFADKVMPALKQLDPAPITAA